MAKYQKKNERIAELERRVAELEASNHQYYWPYWSVLQPYGTCLGCGWPLSNGHVCGTTSTTTTTAADNWFGWRDTAVYG